MKIKTKRRDKAVSEIVGTILLLAIAICVFSVVYMNVLSEDGPNPETYATIIGKMETGYATFEHRRGEGISTDSKVIIIPRGSEEDKIVRTVAELLDPTTSNGDNIWDIGERLRCPEDFTGCKVEAIVIDSVTSSIIMWGTLQEGYIEPPFGMGGIWHFNELEWNGIPNEVIDTSGNNNHGTSYNGATTTNDVVNASAIRSGIFNVIDDDDYVEVHDAYSLDITDQITIEAWIKPFNVDVSGTARLLNQFGFTPYITKVSKNIYVVVSEDQQQRGIIQTVNITPYHKLSDDSILYTFDNFGRSQNPRELRPIITSVSDDIYVVAYNNWAGGNILNVHLKTFNISSDGTIKYTGNELIFDDYVSNTGKSNRPSIIKVSNDIFAIAYGAYIDNSHPSVGIIKTVKISSNGAIQNTENIAKFNETEGYGPIIIHVADDVFAIVYQGPSNLGFVKTFNILSDGSIKYTGNELIFDDKFNDKNLNQPSIIKVSDDVFAIAYGMYIDNSHPGVGTIKTLNIYSNGTIKSTGLNKTFESSFCFDPHIISHSENYYVIVYGTAPSGDSKGNYIRVEIANNGSIKILGPSINFEKEEKCYDPIAIKISERIFAIVYEGKDPGAGTGHPGHLITLPVEYPSDIYSKGIYKLGSYGIYANATKVYGNINTKTINASIIHDTWNYVVLTYNKDAPPNKMNMNLYVNGNLSASRNLSEKIRTTDSNLLFGDLFFGLIDEIAIHDKALTLEEIQSHYDNPGYFENEI